MNLMLTQANALRIPLADESVHCVVTSPPYWGLRDYGLGDAGLGLEPTPEQYVANMVAVFREVRRVLRPDGTLWLNMGDSYATHAGSKNTKHAHNFRSPEVSMKQGIYRPRPYGKQIGLKEKDLCGIPWRVAFALQADGWWLRSDIIWSKPNPMPESVTDRPTKAHEYLFLLTKSAKYYYDADAVREKANYDGRHDTLMKGGVKLGEVELAPGMNAQSFHGRGHERWPHQTEDGSRGRNRRTVWHIATAPYSGAHFATYPPALVEPCIKAGTSERGVCPECGAPWERVTDSHIEHTQDIHNSKYDPDTGWAETGWRAGRKHVSTLGWQPTCECWRDMPDPDAPRTRNARKRYQQDAGDYWKFRAVCRFSITKRATVFDPFGGSMTTLQVARALGRNGVGLDLSLEYLHLARQRLSLDALEAWGKAKKDGKAVTDLPMFEEL